MFSSMGCSGRGEFAYALLACLLALAPSWACGQAHPPSKSTLHPPAPPVLATEIASFSVTGADMAQALHKLRTRDVYHVVIGFERVPHRAGAKGPPITLKLTNTTVGEIIHRLCQADPRYTYSVFQGYVLDVRPKGAEKNPGDLLNIKVHKYDLDANVGADGAIERISEDAPELREFLYQKLAEWVRKTGRPGGLARLDHIRQHAAAAA